MNARLSDDDREGDGDKERHHIGIPRGRVTSCVFPANRQSPNCLKKKKGLRTCTRILQKACAVEVEPVQLPCGSKQRPLPCW